MNQGSNYSISAKSSSVDKSMPQIMEHPELLPIIVVLIKVTSVETIGNF